MTDLIPKSPLPCWCGSRELRLCWRPRAFGLTRCAACGCYRIDPPPMTDSSSCEVFYNEYYQRHRADVGDDGTQQRSRFWRVAAKEPAAVADHGVALDIGCGDGQLCAELSQAGWHSVIGFDVSRPRIKRARRTYPHLQFRDTPIASANVPLGASSLIVMDNVIEHLPDPAQMVGELGTYLSASGRLVVITPNMESGHFRLLGRRWTPELAPHAHIYLFTRSSLIQLVERAGLRVDAVGTFHEPAVSPRETLMRAVRGDAKGAVWRTVQDAGGVYGRVIGQGPMLYVIAQRRTPQADGLVTQAGPIEQPRAGAQRR